MNENKKVGTNWTAIIMVAVIYILIMMWNSQRDENGQAKRVFAEQTARVQNQESVSATKEVEDKTRGCLKANEVPDFAQTDQCVFGFLGLVEESTEPKSDPSEPTFYRSYFDYTATGFHLYGDTFLGAYVNSCVIVWGDIKVGPDGAKPGLLVTEGQYGLNIEKLPDSSCQ